MYFYRFRKMIILQEIKQKLCKNIPTNLHLNCFTPNTY